MTQAVRPLYELKDEDYLKLWMYFENRADEVKEAMFETVTWTIGFAAVILGFIFANLVKFDPNQAAITLSWLVTIAAAAGLVICLYSSFALSEGAKHVQSNWKRADRCKKHVKDLGRIVEDDATEEQETTASKKGTMAIWNQLRIVVGLFAIAFSGVLLWHIAIGIMSR